MSPGLHVVLKNIYASKEDSKSVECIFTMGINVKVVLVYSIIEIFLCQNLVNLN